MAEDGECDERAQLALTLLGYSEPRSPSMPVVPSLAILAIVPPAAALEEMLVEPRLPEACSIANRANACESPVFEL